MLRLDRLAGELGVSLDALIPFGRDAVKLAAAPGTPRGRCILVSSITPTAGGEGKTTLAIGLADALRATGERAVVALRQPSLGPFFGIKGGGAGAGRAALTAAERVDVHFTGDLYAIAAAHNLLAAMIDNHLHHATELAIDPRSITWPRAIDMNDRALRRIVVGLGDVVRETGFVATAASEVMAVLALARDREDVEARLARIVVGARRDGSPVTARDIGAVGAMMVLLADAMLPNLTTTLEGTPAFVHAGPFADIAHGSSSAIATQSALSLADWVVTEAGFGFDLGGEKFFDIVCRSAAFDAAVVVLVCTVRSLIEHGDGAIDRGVPNLAAHVAAARCFGKPVVIAVNRHADDRSEDLRAIERFGVQLDVPVVESDAFARGAAGSLALARTVIDQAREPAPLRFLYQLTDSPRHKLLAIATRMYGARDVSWTVEASRQLDAAVALGADGWPVCVAKTPRSLSDDPHRRGRPADHVLGIREVRAAAGAGYWLAIAGHTELLPGLPRHPRAEAM